MYGRGYYGGGGDPSDLMQAYQGAVGYSPYAQKFQPGMAIQQIVQQFLMLKAMKEQKAKAEGQQTWERGIEERKVGLDAERIQAEKDRWAAEDARAKAKQAQEEADRLKKEAREQKEFRLKRKEFRLKKQKEQFAEQNTDKQKGLTPYQQFQTEWEPKRAYITDKERIKSKRNESKLGIHKQYLNAEGELKTSLGNGTIKQKDYDKQHTQLQADRDALLQLAESQFNADLKDLDTSYGKKGAAPSPAAQTPNPPGPVKQTATGPNGEKAYLINGQWMVYRNSQWTTVK